MKPFAWFHLVLKSRDSADYDLNGIFLNENYILKNILFSIILFSVARDNSALVKITCQCQTDSKPLNKRMLAEICDIFASLDI